ncbi:MAG: molybdate ABC transporter substrate-binding protein [Nitrospiria bacterium]
MNLLWKRLSASFQILLIIGIFLMGDLLTPPSLYGRDPNIPEEALLIAAASNLRFAMNEIAAEFESAHPEKVKISYGSSGSFLAQLIAGAPYDIFFSADESLPQRLISEGLALEAALFRYGIGRLVLWVPRKSKIDLEKEGMKGLLHPSVHKIAIANPRHAPYGAAAVAALQTAGLYDLVRLNLVFGGNISEAAHFVRGGNAEIGMLSYSLAASPPLKEAGRFWPIPTTTYPPLYQGAIILRRSRNIPLAKSFIAFVMGGEGRTILDRYGDLEEGVSR